MRTDEIWKRDVETLAASKATLVGDGVKALIDYLWASPEQYRRLADTPHGGFIRELRQANPCPDYALRAHYRLKLVALQAARTRGVS